MSENPSNFRCPFRATLMTRTFSCEHAHEVTRREGPDIGCDSEGANKSCIALFNEIKDKALPELGFDDDLTSMPASALQKIQYGGLTALHQSLNEQDSKMAITNISQLIAQAYEKFNSLDQFPYDKCVATISSYKIKRRRNKQ